MNWKLNISNTHFATVQLKLFAQGYRWRMSGTDIIDYPFLTDGWIYGNSDNKSLSLMQNESPKEVTIGELIEIR